MEKDSEFQFLTKKYWRFFYKESIINDKVKKIHDGEKFEELVQCLLNEMYADKYYIWEPTPTTHDGNKDFVTKTEDDEIIWAECKSYEKKIDLKTIAATIVMVQINHVAEILFFSYSAINENTKKRLLIYANQTGKTIRFYDGRNLENLILNYPEKIVPSFFPDFKFTDKMQLDYFPQWFHKLGMGIFVSDDVTPCTSEIQVCLDSIIYIGIGIYNRNPSETLNVQISIANENDILFLELLDHNYNQENKSTFISELCIKPQEAKFVPIFFKVSVFKEKILLPELQLLFSNKSQINQEYLKPQYISVDQLFITKLMGSEYENTKEYFANNYFNNNYLKIMLLKGKSGVGKTRMLQEYIGILLAYKYQIINFSGLYNENSSIGLIKELIYKLYNLSEDFIIEALKSPLVEDNVWGDDTQIIINILKELTQNNTLIFQKNKEIIFEKLISTKTAILIDNVQYYDSTLINFISSYITYAKNCNRPNFCILIMAYNIDYPANCNLRELCIELAMLEESNMMCVKTIMLNGFEPYPALGFLRAIISMKDDSLNEILLELVCKVNNNPKLIKEMVKYFYHQKILCASRHDLIVNNYNLLKEELSRFPFEKDNIIQRRWELFVLEKGNKEQYLLLLSIIHFMGKMNKSNCKQIGINQELLCDLYQAGFLAENKDSEFTFEHDIFASYFLEQHDFPQIAISFFATSKVTAFSLHEWQKNLIMMGKNEEAAYVIPRIMKYINLRITEIPYKWQIWYYTKVIYYFEENISKIQDLQQFFQCAAIIGLSVKNTFGSSKAVELYKILYESILMEIPDAKYELHIYYDFLDGYTEALLHMGSSDIIPIYQLQIEYLENNPCLFPDILGKLYNRIYVYYKDKALESQYHVYFEKCQEICKTYELKELEMLNYFDAGTYFWYTQSMDINYISTNWNKAFEIYEKEKFSDAVLFIAKKKIQFALLNKQFSIIKKELDDANNYLALNKRNIQQSLFFYKNINILEITYLLIFNSESDQIPILLSKALTYCTQMDGGMIFNIYFLYGKYYFYKQDIVNMAIYYDLSKKALEKCSAYIYYDFFNKIITDDYSIKMVKLLLQNRNWDLISLCTDESKEIYQKLNTYSQSNLWAIWSEFRTISPISSNDLKDGYIII